MGAAASFEVKKYPGDAPVSAEDLARLVGTENVPAGLEAGVPLSVACAAVGSLPPVPRPATAQGEFLRIITINDCYKLENYPRVAAALKLERHAAASLGCIVKATLPGDFVSPCIITALDGGRAMFEALNVMGFDLLCLGNHEFDLGFAGLAAKCDSFKGTIVNSNTNCKELAHLPKWATFEVGGRTVVVGGFVTGNKAIYPPAALPDITPVDEAIPTVWEAVKAERAKQGAPLPDLFLPLTHQLTPEDKATGKMLSAHGELAGRTPVILGGHDHEVYIDECGGGTATVVKVGADAENIGIVDIWWDGAGELRRAVTLRPATEYPLEPETDKFVKGQEAMLESMMTSPIAVVERPISSKRVRFTAEDSVGSFLLTMLKRGLKSEGVEIALLQGGGIRAKKDYAPGPFTMGDLFQELAFDCAQAVVKLPGKVIAETISNARGAPQPEPKGNANFLHTDGDATVDPTTHALTHVNGQPLDPDRMYTVAIYQYLLTGLGNLEPLLSYAKANVQVPHEECCFPAKPVILGQCMREAWRDLLGFKGWDADGDGRVDREELLAGIDRAMAELDQNGDGKIDRRELAAYFAKARCGEAASASLLEQLISALDTDGDGCVDKGELAAIAF